MKPLRFVAFSFAAASLLVSVSSCTSDRNPFDIAMTNPAVESETAKIRLSLDVASTRADDDLSTAEERKVSKVSIYVFDAQDQLEKFMTDISVSSTAPIELEVAPGRKTLYAITSKTVISSTLETGTPIETFEETLFSSTLSDLKTTNGFVMAGKSDVQMVLKSANSNEVPNSNIFKIELVRMLSKTQVKRANDMKLSDFGLRINGPMIFRVSQTNDKMRLVADAAKEVWSEYKDDNEDGTCNGYSVGKNLEFQGVVTTDFTAEGCHYITENIVQSPLSGNTTFVSLCVPYAPINYYRFNSVTSSAEIVGPYDTPGQSFFAVGIVDEKYGMEDFAMDPSNNHVIVFKDKTNADNYRDALNQGNASAITVSESDSPLRAPAVRASEVHYREFSTVIFELGKAYYRINISSGETDNYKIIRNKFYKINIKSIDNLGFHSEDLLRPKDPTSDPGNATTAWIEAQLTVAPWEDVNQDVDL